MRFAGAKAVKRNGGGMITPLSGWTAERISFCARHSWRSEAPVSSPEAWRSSNFSASQICSVLASRVVKSPSRVARSNRSAPTRKGGACSSCEKHALKVAPPVLAASPPEVVLFPCLPTLLSVCVRSGPFEDAGGADSDADERPVRPETVPVAPYANTQAMTHRLEMRGGD
eukprot:3127835-Pleurochrysis_carterae.AAC.3